VDLSSWRAALNGAEPVNPETLERFAERFASYGFRREAQLPVYGLAEAALAVTVPPLNRGHWLIASNARRSRAGSRGAGGARDETAIAFVSSGKPLPGHDVCLVAEHGNEVPDRTEGFLWFRGPSRLPGTIAIPKRRKRCCRVARNGEGEYAWVNSAIARIAPKVKSTSPDA